MTTGAYHNFSDRESVRGRNSSLWGLERQVARHHASLLHKLQLFNLVELESLGNPAFAFLRKGRVLYQGRDHRDGRIPSLEEFLSETNEVRWAIFLHGIKKELDHCLSGRLR